MADGRTKAEHRNDRVEDLLGAVVPLRAREIPSSSAEADLGNVVFFAPRRRPGAKPAPAIPVTDDTRPAPRPVMIDRRGVWTALVVASLAVHACLLAAAFLREPSPHASIGLEVISVEMVLGANQAAGLVQTPSQSEDAVNAREVPREDKPEALEREVARQETQSQPAAAQPIVAEIPPEPQKEPELTVTEKPSEKPVSIVAVPNENPEVKSVDKPKPETKPAAKRKRDDGKNARDRAAPAASNSVASSGVGRGRSDADSNYRGLVSAHLARHKQFPADARSRGDQGTASVTFSLDGGGRVTSVRLARGSGVASIDQETQAMVRRASPFPAPPSGRGMSFTVPVQFYLR